MEISKKVKYNKKTHQLFKVNGLNKEKRRIFITLQLLLQLLLVIAILRMPVV